MDSYTDTYGGEANYSWCRRYEFNADGMSNLAIVRKAKKLCGINGVRGKMVGCNFDFIKFRPYRCCTVMFITFDYNCE